ncbi:photosystem II protein Psb27 [Spirulina sp. 06S082]|uniref:photosystem II protein Psb27 n=1 Tax=Spirulina sp. 06S082 TaxID=3110248 RepID=UPI002B1F18DD|nr:photosystem II protein Psb27 [Spirulina sp. 06S082]MEA5469588.1 photosystem II protein Psb27 [Spirulina sp. 06S082]
MFFQSFFSRLFALVLVAAIALTGCSSASLLSGNYREDTLTTIENLSEAIALSGKEENFSETVASARSLMNDYASRYRRDSRVSGLRSFTTMQTALNNLAGFYGTYGVRPLASKLSKRLQQEFKEVEFTLKRGF